jgi:hypothetical protein
MKTGETKMSAAIKTPIQLAAVWVLVTCIFFARGAALMGFAGAAIFTVSFWSRPDSFRSWRGSLRPAFYLAAFVWVCAVSLFLLSLFGLIE